MMNVMLEGSSFDLIVGVKAYPVSYHWQYEIQGNHHSRPVFVGEINAAKGGRAPTWPQTPGALFRAMLDVLRTVHYDRETGWNRLGESDEGNEAQNLP